MLRLGLLALFLLVLVVPALAHASDSVQVSGGVLAYSVDPTEPQGVKLRLGSFVKQPCQIAMKDRKAGGKITQYDAGGPCLVFDAGDFQHPRTISAGAGCVAVWEDGAVCPLAGVSRLVVNGGPHADEIHTTEAAIGHYYAMPDDDPISIPVPVEMNLGAGDDLFDDGTGGVRDAPVKADVRCGDGRDTLKVGKGLVFNPDCEDGTGFPMVAPGAAGGSIGRAGDVVSYVSPAGEGYVSVGDHADVRGQPHLMLSGERTPPQQLGPGCVLLSSFNACPAAGIKRVKVKTDPAVAGGARVAFEHLAQPPVTELDLGAKNDEAFVANKTAEVVSCGAGVDAVKADKLDTVEADCEHAERAGTKLPGIALRLPRTLVWEQHKYDGYQNRTYIRATCPSSAPDDSCGGKLDLMHRGKRYVGTAVYAIPRGKTERIFFAFQRGEGPGLANIASTYASMRRELRSGGSPYVVELRTGGSLVKRRATFTRLRVYRRAP